MTTLMPDPINQWLAADVRRPRAGLRQEMHDSFDCALSLPAGNGRAYWTGVGTGYAVAFGLTSRDALDQARRSPGAYVLNPLDTPRFPFYADEETHWASGVLYGYKQGTSELPDADECLHCAQRLLDGDDTEFCEHGLFCADCVRTWHTPVAGLGLCRFLDDLRSA